LAKTPLVAMQASLPRGPGMSPGEKSPLVVTVTGPDGKTLQTEGAGRGKVLWEDLRVTSSIVTVDKKGMVTLPADPRLSDGKVPHLTVTVPSHQDLRCELDIPVRYDRSFAADFSGRSGMSGMDGFAGTSGSSGSSGSLDSDNPSAGGDGSDGSDGSDGGDGLAGMYFDQIRDRVQQNDHVVSAEVRKIQIQQIQLW
jgi:hypothetical protein